MGAPVHDKFDEGRRVMIMPTYNVLVVDDEAEIRDAIEIYLKSEDIHVLKAGNGQEALAVLEQEEVHLIILDIMMPQMDGLKATFAIRESKNIPIIMLSAKSEDTDKILGLTIGADDYVTKPFNPLELVARVKSQLRRYTHLGNYTAREDEIRVRGLVLNKREKTVYVDGEEARLTPTEYKILELLMENRGRVFSIEEIYEKVWKEPCLNADNTVAVHVRRIREKIEINPKEPQYLKVVWGIGYKIEK
jgi:DNA-binding response OmpR family regulator